MVQRVQKFLSAGYTIQTWLDEDFLYSYYLWINVPSDTLGVSLVLSVLLKHVVHNSPIIIYFLLQFCVCACVQAAIRFHSPPSIRSTDHSLPGIIGSTFFA